MLDKVEIKTMQNIESKYYMQPMLAKIRVDIADLSLVYTADFIKPLSYLIKYVNENL